MSYDHKEFVQSESKKILSKNFKYTDKGVWVRISTEEKEQEKAMFNRQIEYENLNNDSLVIATQLIFLIFILSLTSLFFILKINLFKGFLLFLCFLISAPVIKEVIYKTRNNFKRILK